MRKPLLLAALALPLVWAAGSIAWNQQRLGQAREWRIPVEGADPRDPLRGQFVRFTYGWQVKGDGAQCDRPEGCTLCLADEGGTVVATIAAPAASCPHAVDPAASAIRITPAFRVGDQPRFEARIFVSESSAPRLQQQLAEGPMVVVAALTPEGRLVNRRLEPLRD